MKRTILFFHANYCGKCQSIKKRLSRLEHEGILKIETIVYNIDIDTKMVKKYKVEGVPTLILLENRKEIRRFTGSAYREDIIEFIR